MNLSTFFRTNYRVITAIGIVIFLSLPLRSFTQTFFGVSSNPADGGTLTTTTVAVTPPAAMQAGDLVVIYAQYKYNSRTLSMSALGGQAWTTETQYNDDDQRTRIFWCRFNGTWAADPVVSRTTGGGTQPLSAIMYVYRPSSSNNSWGKHAGPNNDNTNNATVPVTGLTTTVPNTVTMAFWGSEDDVTWGTLTGTGWSKTGLSDQYRNTGGSDQSHTGAYNILTTAGPVSNVSQVRSGASINTVTSIISWYEIPPPSNDECSNAVNLAVNFACSNIPGTMAYATPSPILLTPCTGTLGADVWYKFTAVNNTATVTVGSPGSSISSNVRIQVLTGNCGSFTNVACSTGPSLTMSGTLTAGTTYYVRVFSNNGTLPVNNADFNICVTSSVLPSVRFGNSYVNISKKTTGGVVEPGDTLEIRMTVQHSQTGTMTNLRFVDNIPVNTTMLAGANDSIRVITNEGLTYKKYTPAADADAATYLAAPPAGQFNIRMNLSFGTSNPGTLPDNTSTNITTTTGSMVRTNRPIGGGNLLFATAYRVVASGGLGDTITLNPAQFIYRAGGPDIILTATPYKILISDPVSLCPNSIGINNAAELGGTFGSGPTLNRPTDLTNPIPGYSFLNNVSGTNGLGDGRYAIVNNISPRSGTNRNANRIPNCGSPPANDPIHCDNRMHGGHWDIDGDHTGTNDAIGNIPPDGTTNSGYMLMVNADYVASEVFSQTLNNLCPDTYYEFSAWFRNICPTCGSDSTNGQFAGTPTAPAAGYVGVYPNLSFALDGLDYYSTGEIDVVGWLKKGFVFRTGPAQTDATFSIRNNSQGGGGNDWVMDDIAVATCLPTMSYSPTINPNVCVSNPIIIADTISSFFKNYTTYKWQRSINGGANWTDITGVTTLPDTNYYITTYTVPVTATTLADSGNLYRVVVATTADNLTDPNCNISDGVTITLSVLDCIVLDIELLSFNGKLVDSKAILSWSTSQEGSPVTFIIERSTDGRNFSAAGESPGYNNGKSINHYSFTNLVSVSDKVWYRIVIVTPDGRKKHSAIIQLRNDRPDFELNNIINPFRSNLSFSITSSGSSVITIELIDMTGKTVLSNKQMVYAGTNSINLTGTQSLASGIYTLRVIKKDKFITKRMVKKN